MRNRIILPSEKLIGPFLSRLIFHGRQDVWKPSSLIFYLFARISWDNVIRVLFSGVKSNWSMLKVTLMVSLC